MTTPDATLQALLDAGLGAHRAGRLSEARAAYEAMLARDPGQFDALHMLGVVHVQLGEPQRGSALIERATRIAPRDGPAHINLAMAQSALGRHDLALASAERALALDASSPDAHVNRGNALLALGRADEALTAYERALALRPADPQAHYNRGNALRDLDRLEESVGAYDAAIARRPGYPEALANRGAVFVRLQRLEEALASYDAATAAPGVGVEAYVGRGGVLARMCRFEDALASYDVALAADPTSADAHSNRASALNELARPMEAQSAADRAIALRPDLGDAHNNRGIALYNQRRLDEALASYDRAVSLNPNSAEAHNNRALARLRAGDLAAGFAEYRWRWKVGDASHYRPALDCPEWAGEPPTGKRLLIFAEQGFGDSLQFVRYVPMAAALGAEVTLLVEPPLVRLFRASLPSVRVVQGLPNGEAFDLQIAMLCLPRVFGTTLETIPATTPYLASDPYRAAAWAARLATLPGRKVGLVWAGAARRHNPGAAAIDARRSVQLAQLVPLSAAADVQFVSLQIGEPAEEARTPPPGMRLVDWTSEIGDFADTAALVEALDLVITVDTAVAHLAGALGKPVWILSRYDGCWRWLNDRETSPWYPTARLFHQAAPGAWDPVITAVAAALRGPIGSDAPPLPK